MQTKTATKAQVVSRAGEMGITFSYEDECARLDPPAGKVMANTGCHYYDLHNSPRGAWKMPNLYAELLDEMVMGIEDCDTKDCEYCGS